MDVYGGISMAITGETDCDLESARDVLEQRISGYSLVEGVVSVDQEQLHVMVSGETLDVTLATPLFASYKVEFAKVLSTAQGSPGATGRWLVSRADPIVHFQVSDPSEFTAGDVLAAHLDAAGYQRSITVTLNDASASTFAELTGSMVGQQLAIIVDGSVASAPIVNERISGGQVQLAGLDWGQAAWLATALNTAPLPCTLTLTELTALAPTGTQSER